MNGTWEGTEEELDAAILKHNEGFQKYEKDYVDMTRKNDVTIERCKSLLIRASRENQSIPEIEPAPKENRSNGARAAPTFKPQADLKPIFLAKDCSLMEFTEFTKAYIIYMNSSGTPIPRDAVFSHLRVHVDAWWQHNLEWRGMKIHSDISHFAKVMDITARIQFPIHARRMKVFSTQKQPQ